MPISLHQLVTKYKIPTNQILGLFFLCCCNLKKRDTAWFLLLLNCNTKQQKIHFGQMAFGIWSPSDKMTNHDLKNSKIEKQQTMTTMKSYLSHFGELAIKNKPYLCHINLFLIINSSWILNVH